jgi:hypothetical protein
MPLNMSSPLPLLALFITKVDYEPLSIHNHPNIDIMVAKFSTYVVVKVAPLMVVFNSCK